MMINAKNTKIVNNKEIVRIHNNFINAIFHLSIDAKKLLLIIWLHANEDGKNIKIYRQDIIDKIGIDLKNLKNEHREKIIDELMKSIVTIRDADNPSNFTKIQLVYKTRYENGILYTNIDEELLKYIKEAQEKLFTRFKIQNIKPLNSIYAIRLYLLAKQFEDTGWRIMSIDELKRIVGIENKYKKITDLKRRVLEVAKKQINKNTDIEIDYELIKEKKKFTQIKIIVKKKEKIKTEEKEIEKKGEIMNNVIKDAVKVKSDDYYTKKIPLKQEEIKNRLKFLFNKYYEFYSLDKKKKFLLHKLEFKNNKILMIFSYEGKEFKMIFNTLDEVKKFFEKFNPISIDDVLQPIKNYFLEKSLNFTIQKYDLYARAILELSKEYPLPVIKKIIEFMLYDTKKNKFYQKVILNPNGFKNNFDAMKIAFEEEYYDA